MNESKVVLVSGGSRGLGAAIVHYLLDHQYSVVTFSRSETEFIKQCRETKAYQGRFDWEPVDAKDYAAIKKLVFNSYKKYGRIDALINNAGVTLEQLLPLTGEQEIDAVLQLNLGAVIQLTRYVSRLMLNQSNGTIINISSVVGLRGYKGTAVYSATKAALDGLTRSLARELGSKGIRVNSIAPGFMNTDMTKDMPESRRAQIIRRTPLGRLGETSDVVGLVRFLLSEEANFITGQTMVIDGGLTC